MTWLRTYIAICAAVVAVVVVSLGLLVSFVDLGLSGHGIAALLLGAFLTVALAMVLMGLAFSSSRGGRDETVYAARTAESQGEAPLSPKP